MSYHELSVAAAFFVLVLLWFFRKPQFMTGWADKLPDESEVYASHYLMKPSKDSIARRPRQHI